MKPNWDDAPIEATHWCEAKHEWRDEAEESIGDCCIRIPDTTPPSPEWDGEGLPPVGLTNKEFTLMTRISVACNDHPSTEYEVVAHRHGMAVIAGKSHVKEFAHIVTASECRPLRTKEQMEMEEIKALALSEVADRVSGHHRVESIKQAIAALYDAGMLRKVEQ